MCKHSRGNDMARSKFSLLIHFPFLTQYIKMYIGCTYCHVWVYIYKVYFKYNRQHKKQNVFSNITNS